MLLISREQPPRLAALQMSPPLAADTMSSKQHLANKCWMADKNDSLQPCLQQMSTANGTHMWERLYTTLMPMNLDHISKRKVFSENVFLKIGIFRVSNLIIFRSFCLTKYANIEMARVELQQRLQSGFEASGQATDNRLSRQMTTHSIALPPSDADINL